MTLLKLKHWTEFRYMEMRCQFFFFLEISQGSLLHFWGLQALEAPLMLPSHLWDTSSAEKGWHLFLLSCVLWDELCSSRGSWQGEAAGVGVLLSSSSSASLLQLQGKNPGEGAGSAWCWCHTALLSPWAHPSRNVGALHSRDMEFPVNLGQKITWPKDKAPVSLDPLLGKLCQLLPDMQIFQFPEPTKTSTAPCREEENPRNYRKAWAGKDRMVWVHRDLKHCLLPTPAMGRMSIIWR